MQRHAAAVAETGFIAPPLTSLAESLHCRILFRVLPSPCQRKVGKTISDNMLNFGVHDDTRRCTDVPVLSHRLFVRLHGGQDP